MLPIMLNFVLPLIGIMNIMKINQYEIHKKCMDIKLWFIRLKHTKTWSSFHMKHVEI
jgi:hypothetical protein